MKSTDGGASWNNIAGQLNFGLASIQMISDMTGWATSGPAIMKTTDSGVTWKSDYQGATGFGSSSMHFFDSNHGWAVGEAGKIVAYNSGSTGLQEPGETKLPLKASQTDNGIKVSYQVNQPGKTQLLLLDITGRTVSSLQESDQPSGIYNNDYVLPQLPAGIYLLRLSQSGSTETTRILLH